MAFRLERFGTKGQGLVFQSLVVGEYHYALVHFSSNGYYGETMKTRHIQVQHDQVDPLLKKIFKGFDRIGEPFVKFKVFMFFNE